MVVTPIFACFVANLKSDLFMINLYFSKLFPRLWDVCFTCTAMNASSSGLAVSDFVDTIAFGDEASESSHETIIIRGEAIEGARGEPARKLLPRGVVDRIGEDLTSYI